MSDRNNKVLPDFSNGLPSALKLWLFFLICLVFLRYPVPFSILVGGVGGFAGGWVVDWWNTKDEPRDFKSEEAEESEETPGKVSGLKLAKQRREAKAKKQSQGLPLTGLLRRD